ncbi:MAG: hypothetical protein EOP11_13570 [Proteobacteria bacterium]|nr:MAG: hypothetical protein EOP11_13570 [Pseudomonadota bacterium]
MNNAKKFSVLLAVIFGIAVVAFLLDTSGEVNPVRGGASPAGVEVPRGVGQARPEGGASPLASPPFPTAESAVAITRSAKPGNASETLSWPTVAVVNTGAILKQKSGEPVLLSRSAAFKACADRGMRQATIRELVAWGGTILAPGEVDESSVPPGHAISQVIAIDPDGTEDSFNALYSAAAKTNLPHSELAGHFVWSASKNAKGPGEFYSLDIDHGYISSGEAEDPDPRYHLGAVRCEAIR